MFEKECKRFGMLNELAKRGGIVILGGTEDKLLPTGELKQAFSIEENIYNRSVTDLSLFQAESVYDTCIDPLAPETLFLHIGEKDIGFFKENAEEFVQKYVQLIVHIKEKNEACHIVVVSLRNYEKDEVVKELNRQLSYIADSQRCAYADIANPRVWNPKSTMETVSFVYSLGFVRPLKTKRPVHDLAKLLFLTVV